MKWEGTGFTLMALWVRFEMFDPKKMLGRGGVFVPWLWRVCMKSGVLGDEDVRPFLPSKSWEKEVALPCLSTSLSQAGRLG